jgi:hypothetical protein
LSRSQPGAAQEGEEPQGTACLRPGALQRALDIAGARVPPPPIAHHRRTPSRLPVALDVVAVVPSFSPAASHHRSSTPARPRAALVSLPPHIACRRPVVAARTLACYRSHRIKIQRSPVRSDMVNSRRCARSLRQLLDLVLTDQIDANRSQYRSNPPWSSFFCKETPGLPSFASLSFYHISFFTVRSWFLHFSPASLVFFADRSLYLL